MSNEQKKNPNILPQSLVGKVAIFLIVIVAFSFGYIISGDSDSGSEMHEHTSANNEPTEWTCSMHPQIILPKPGKCPICFMDLIPLEKGTSSGLNPNQIRLSENARAIAQIQTTEVRSGSVSSTINLTGKIGYDETNVTTLSSRFKGRVEKLFINFTGAEVKKGDKLFSVYSPELLTAVEELKQAKKYYDANIDSKELNTRSLAETNYNAVKEKFILLGFSKSDIARLEELTSDTILFHSPQSGIVVSKNINEGDYISEGTKLFQIADLSNLWVLFDAYETDVNQISIGDKISFTTKSIPGRTFESKVTFVDYVIDPKTQTAEVRSEIDNSGNLLKPDMLTSGMIQKSSKNKSDYLLIPETAPLLTGKRAIVYVETTDSLGEYIYEGRQVNLGPKSGAYYSVLDGLASGEHVVTNGAFKIDAELQIQAKESMMSDKFFEKNEQEHSNEQMVVAKYKEPSVEMSYELLNELTPLYDVYFEIQWPLAMDDYEKTISGYKKLLDVISGLNDDQRYVLVSYLPDMKKYASLGSKATDITIARDVFFHLSKKFIEMHNKFGHADDKNYYLTFCPMARDNAGAYWLQTKDTVYNSFYGDMMLHCGSIEDTLEPESK